MDQFLRQLLQAAHGGGAHHGPASYAQDFRCFSAALLPNRDNVENGGKIVLPPSALNAMSQLDLEYPLLFELKPTHPRPGPPARAHCGVLEFSAEEGRMYVPYWMMRDMRVEEGDLVNLRTVTLPPGSFVKLQPESTAFIEISNPRAVLEQVLRNFSALGEGQTICIKYNDKEFWLRILEVKPQHPTKAISIVDTDVNVEFAAPLDYVEPERLAPASAASSAPLTASASASSLPGLSSSQVRVHLDSDSESDDEPGKFKPFSGSSGMSVSGRVPRRKGSTPSASPKVSASTGKSLSSSTVIASSDSEDEDEGKGKSFVPFAGKGYSLRG